MNLTITQTNQRKTNPFLEVLRNRNFRLLWIGEAISVLGDHFYLHRCPAVVRPASDGRCTRDGRGPGFGSCPARFAHAHRRRTVRPFPAA